MKRTAGEDPRVYSSEVILCCFLTVDVWYLDVVSCTVRSADLKTLFFPLLLILSDFSEQATVSIFCINYYQFIFFFLLNFSEDGSTLSRKNARDSICLVHVCFYRKTETNFSHQKKKPRQINKLAGFSIKRKSFRNQNLRNGKQAGLCTFFHFCGKRSFFAIPIKTSPFLAQLKIYAHVLNITSYKSLSPRLVAGTLLQPEWLAHKKFPCSCSSGLRPHSPAK